LKIDLFFLEQRSAKGNTILCVFKYKSLGTYPRVKNKVLCCCVGEWSTGSKIANVKLLWIGWINSQALNFSWTSEKVIPSYDIALPSFLLSFLLLLHFAATLLLFRSYRYLQWDHDLKNSFYHSVQEIVWEKETTNIWDLKITNEIYDISLISTLLYTTTVHCASKAIEILFLGFPGSCTKNTYYSSSSYWHCFLVALILVKAKIIMKLLMSD